MNDEANELGRRLVRILVVAALFVIGMMVWGKAWAQSMIATDRNGNSMTLQDSPCADGKVLALILAQVQAKYQSHFKAGVMIYNGKTHQACWMAYSDGMVYVIDDSGDISSVPQSMFKRAHGV